MMYGCGCFARSFFYEFVWVGTPVWGRHVRPWTWPTDILWLSHTCFWLYHGGDMHTCCRTTNVGNLLLLLFLLLLLDSFWGLPCKPLWARGSSTCLLAFQRCLATGTQATMDTETQITQSDLGQLRSAGLQALHQVFKVPWTRVVLLGSDCNDHSPLWGPRTARLDYVGGLVEGVLSESNLLVVNSSDSPATFYSDHGNES